MVSLKSIIKKYSDGNLEYHRLFDSVSQTEHVSKYYPVAQIATKLIPLVDKGIGKDTHIKVVGYDGSGMVRENYPWLPKIKEWVGKGCTIDYLLLNPTQEVIETAADLTQSSNGAFRAYRVDHDSDLSDDLQEDLSDWLVQHFTLFSNPQSMWLESYHPPHEPEAKDCHFINENLDSSPLYTMLNHRFDYVVENAGKLIKLD